MNAPRKAITDKMKWQACMWRGQLCCPECDQLLWPDRDDIEWDHAHALVFDGVHKFQNIRPMHAHCHAAKTIRDVKANAKVKRLERQRNGEPKRKRKSRPIPSRPFPKRGAA